MMTSAAKDEFILEYSSLGLSVVLLLPGISIVGGVVLLIGFQMAAQGCFLMAVAAIYGAIPFFRPYKIVKTPETIAIIKRFGENAALGRDEIYRTKNGTLQVGDLVISFKFIKNPKGLIGFLGPENIADKRNY